MVRRVLIMGYGVAAYLAFLAVFVYTVGFLADVGVWKGIDDGISEPVWVAVLINVALLSLFALQHSVMARPWFKRWWTRLVPAPVERSTYVLAASSVLALLLWQWRPLTESLWSVGNDGVRATLWALYGVGWVLVVASTFLISHFDLFGLRQVAARARQRAYAPLGFREPLVYRFVRHPIMVGFLVAFWAAPDMSAGRLLFAALATGYILVAVRLEERDLTAQLGDAYTAYAAKVPRFVPRLRPRVAGEPAVSGEAPRDWQQVAQDPS